MRHALAVAVLVVAGAFAWIALGVTDPGAQPVTTPEREEAAEPQLAVDAGTAPLPLAVRLGDPADAVQDAFRRPPKAGLLFDVDTGEVLWRRNPTSRRPIASHTKMMTGLVVVDQVGAGETVKITNEALRYRGSAVGLLPRGRYIGVSTMLHGLMLPSGNDAARALAQKAGRTFGGFIALMNARAAALGLTCSRFASVDGLRDEGNHSCPADLAVIARAVLREPRLARIVARRSVVLPFPIKGGKLYLNNHNPLLRTGYPGTTGIKTGYTARAGRCLVATSRRNGRHLGVVLLDSPDPGRQARHLLDRGFAVNG